MEEINSGGSLGDFFRPEFKSLSELNVFLRTFAGDLYTSNFFFQQWMALQTSVRQRV